MEKIKKYSGFTMIELLVVVVIIGVLMAVGMVSYVGIGRNARDTKRKSDLNTLQKEFEMYYQANTAYPTGADAGSCYDSLIGTITTSVKPVDPDTRADYYWHCSEQAYCICSDYLEVQLGNSADENCNFDNTGSFYCIRSVQTLDNPVF